MSNTVSSSEDGHKTSGDESADLDNFLKLIEQNDSFPVDSFSPFSSGNLSENPDYSVTATVNLFSDDPDTPPSSIYILDGSQSQQSLEDNAESSGHSTNTVNDSNEAASSQSNETADGEEKEEGQRHFVIHPSEEPKAPVVPKVVITQPSSSNLMSTDLADSESTDSLPPPRTKTKCCSIL